VVITEFAVPMHDFFGELCVAELADGEFGVATLDLAECAASL